MNALKTTLLMGLMTGLAVGVGYLLGGQGGMLIAFAIAAVMNFVSYWFSDKIVLAMYGAQEIQPDEGPDLHALVDELSRRAGIPKPRVYVVPSVTPNAFATGRNPQHAAVAVTEGILNILTREELMAVLAHELGHVRNRDILVGTIAATLAGAISMLANMFMWTSMMGGRSNEREGSAFGVIGAVLAMIFAPMAAALIQMAISRSREYGADEASARLMGSGRPLANALRKLHNGNAYLAMQGQEARVEPATAHMFIVNPLSGQGFAGLFSTHPPVEERIARLEAM